MPFQAYRAFFKPEELDILNEAYEAAWQHVRSTSVGMTPSQAIDLKNRLAKMILASSCTGARDRERLTEIALRGVSRGSLTEKKVPSRKAVPIDRH